MNVRPDDLAYIVGNPYLGHLVTVIRWSPQGKDVLPDGYPALNKRGGGWICEKASGTFTADLGGGRKRQARYAVIGDAFLRPIRDPGDDAIDETLLRLPSPSREKEEA